MRLTKIFLITIFFISASGVCYGQQYTEDENWLKGFDTEADKYPTLVYWYNEFSSDDLSRAKHRLKTVRLFTPQNEWEGIYSGQWAAVGDEKLIWNERGGFFHFYYYHRLKYMNHGTVENTPDAIKFISEKPSNDKKEQSAAEIYIKVKFGERIYLVPEKSLRLFCETAVGVNTENDVDHWEKEGNLEKKIFGLPIVPEKYKHLIRLPIDTEILRVGERKIIPNEQSTEEYNFDDIHYLVTLGAGKNKGLKVGMNFYVEDLGEWIEITKVFQKTSGGFIRRDFDENKTERCRDSEGGSGQDTPCYTIKAGMKVKTKTHDNF